MKKIASNTKSQSKGGSKGNPKKDSKGNSKEDSKGNPKENSKGNPKEDSKHIPNQLIASEANTYLDHLSALDIDSKPLTKCLTGIVCTIGPASRDVNVLVAMINAGMTIARLNFSHGSYEYHLETIKNVRKAVDIVTKQLDIDYYSVAIALDIRGPKIRTGILEGGPTAEVELIKGQTVKVTIDDKYSNKGSNKVIYVDYKSIIKLVEGNRIYIEDGIMSLVVKSVGSDHLICEIESGGKLGSRKGINLPGAVVDLPPVSEKDKKDLQFGVKQGVDMIFASFIRNGSGVKEIRNILTAEKGPGIPVISKVESHEGVRNIDEIIKESDGVMVARGDMGIEIPLEKVFLAQKMMIAKSNIAGKAVICATQMLESMTSKPRPTRAEVSDVANAVLDGADCVMLSGESAKGDYPTGAVSTMHSICMEAEAAIYSKRVFHELCNKTPAPADAVTCIAISAVNASLKSSANAIIILTTISSTAILVSKYKPRCPIIAVTPNKQIARQTRLYRGIIPFLCVKQSNNKEFENQLKDVLVFSKKLHLIKTNDTIVVVMVWKDGNGITTELKLNKVK